MKINIKNDNPQNKIQQVLDQPTVTIDDLNALMINIEVDDKVTNEEIWSMIKTILKYLKDNC